MSEQLNRLKYQQFVRQARGNAITDMQVNRVDRRDKVVLQYQATAKVSRQRLTGEWAITRASDDQVKGEIQKFLEQARKDFFVRRGEGLQDDAFKDTAQEVDPVKAIQAEEKK